MLRHRGLSEHGALGDNRDAICGVDTRPGDSVPRIANLARRLSWCFACLELQRALAAWREATRRACVAECARLLELQAGHVAYIAREAALAGAVPESWQLSAIAPHIDGDGAPFLSEGCRSPSPISPRAPHDPLDLSQCVSAQNLRDRLRRQLSSQPQDREVDAASAGLSDQDMRPRAMPYGSSSFGASRGAFGEELVGRADAFFHASVPQDGGEVFLSHEFRSNTDYARFLLAVLKAWRACVTLKKNTALIPNTESMASQFVNLHYMSLARSMLLARQESMESMAVFATAWVALVAWRWGTRAFSAVRPVGEATLAGHQDMLSLGVLLHWRCWALVRCIIREAERMTGGTFVLSRRRHADTIGTSSLERQLERAHGSVSAVGAFSFPIAVMSSMLSAILCGWRLQVVDALRFQSVERCWRLEEHVIRVEARALRCAAAVAFGLGPQGTMGLCRAAMARWRDEVHGAQGARALAALTESAGSRLHRAVAALGAARSTVALGSLIRAWHAVAVDVRGTRSVRQRVLRFASLGGLCRGTSRSTSVLEMVLLVWRQAVLHGSADQMRRALDRHTRQSVLDAALFCCSALQHTQLHEVLAAWKSRVQAAHATRMMNHLHESVNLLHWRRQEGSVHFAQQLRANNTAWIAELGLHVWQMAAVEGRYLSALEHSRLLAIEALKTQGRRMERALQGADYALLFCQCEALLLEMFALWRVFLATARVATSESSFRRSVRERVLKTFGSLPDGVLLAKHNDTLALALQVWAREAPLAHTGRAAHALATEAPRWARNAALRVGVTLLPPGCSGHPLVSTVLSAWARVASAARCHQQAHRSKALARDVVRRAVAAGLAREKASLLSETLTSWNMALCDAHLERSGRRLIGMLELTRAQRQDFVLATASVRSGAEAQVLLQISWSVWRDTTLRGVTNARVARHAHLADRARHQAAHALLARWRHADLQALLRTWRCAVDAAQKDAFAVRMRRTLRTRLASCGSHIADRFVECSDVGPVYVVFASWRREVRRRSSKAWLAAALENVCVLTQVDHLPTILILHLWSQAAVLLRVERAQRNMSVRCRQGVQKSAARALQMVHAAYTAEVLGEWRYQVLCSRSCQSEKQWADIVKQREAQKHSAICAMADRFGHLQNYQDLVFVLHVWRLEVLDNRRQRAADKQWSRADRAFECSNDVLLCTNRHWDMHVPFKKWREETERSAKLVRQREANMKSRSRLSCNASRAFDLALQHSDATALYAVLAAWKQHTRVASAESKAINLAGSCCREVRLRSLRVAEVLLDYAQSDFAYLREATVAWRQAAMNEQMRSNQRVFLDRARERNVRCCELATMPIASFFVWELLMEWRTFVITAQLSTAQSRFTDVKREATSRGKDAVCRTINRSTNVYSRLEMWGIVHLWRLGVMLTRQESASTHRLQRISNTLRCLGHFLISCQKFSGVGVFFTQWCHLTENARARRSHQWMQDSLSRRYHAWVVVVASAFLDRESAGSMFVAFTVWRLDVVAAHTERRIRTLQQSLPKDVRLLSTTVANEVLALSERGLPLSRIVMLLWRQASLAERSEQARVQSIRSVREKAQRSGISMIARFSFLAVRKMLIEWRCWTLLVRATSFKHEYMVRVQKAEGTSDAAFVFAVWKSTVIDIEQCRLRDRSQCLAVKAGSFASALIAAEHDVSCVKIALIIWFSWAKMKQTDTRHGALKDAVVAAQRLNAHLHGIRTRTWITREVDRCTSAALASMLVAWRWQADSALAINRMRSQLKHGRISAAERIWGVGLLSPGLALRQVLLWWREHCRQIACQALADATGRCRSRTHSVCLAVAARIASDRKEALGQLIVSRWQGFVRGCRHRKRSQHVSSENVSRLASACDDAVRQLLIVRWQEFVRGSNSRKRTQHVSSAIAARMASTREDAVMQLLIFSWQGIANAGRCRNRSRDCSSAVIDRMTSAHSDALRLLLIVSWRSVVRDGIWVASADALQHHVARETLRHRQVSLRASALIEVEQHIALLQHICLWWRLVVVSTVWEDASRQFGRDRAQWQNAARTSVARAAGTQAELFLQAAITAWRAALMVERALVIEKDARKRLKHAAIEGMARDAIQTDRIRESSLSHVLCMFMAWKACMLQSMQLETDQHVTWQRQRQQALASQIGGRLQTLRRLFAMHMILLAWRYGVRSVSDSAPALLAESPIPEVGTSITGAVASPMRATLWPGPQCASCAVVHNSVCVLAGIAFLEWRLVALQWRQKENAMLILKTAQFMRSALDHRVAARLQRLSEDVFKAWRRTSAEIRYEREVRLLEGERGALLRELTALKDGRDRCKRNTQEIIEKSQTAAILAKTLLHQPAPPLVLCDRSHLQSAQG